MHTLTAQYFESMNNVTIKKEKTHISIDINNGQLTVYFSPIEQGSITIYHNNHLVLEQIKDYTIHEFLCLCKGLRVKLQLQIKHSQRTGEYGC